LKYDEEDNNQNNNENVITSDIKPNHTNNINDKKEKIVKSKHVYTEVEQQQLLDKAKELKKAKYSVYSSKCEKISAHLIDFTKSIQNNEEIDQDCLVFMANCHCCGEEGENKMCICTIPFFKEIIITCFKCEKCGFKTADVKGGGGMSDKARKIILKVEKPADLNRDLFKSETSKIVIPELEFETDTGSLGGMFTTVEGLLEKIVNNLENIPFSFGDSSVGENKMDLFLVRFKTLLTGNKPFTVIMDDPLSNSFIFSPLFPEKDPQLEVIDYERTWEQNEELGINDMNVDHYEEEESKTIEESSQKEVQRGSGG